MEFVSGSAFCEASGCINAAGACERGLSVPGQQERRIGSKPVGCQRNVGLSLNGCEIASWVRDVRWLDDVAFV